MADPALARVVRPSQGAHVVVPRDVLPGDAALLIPRTADGRVLFAVPWYGAVLLGTTDEQREDAPLDPQRERARDRVHPGDGARLPGGSLAARAACWRASRGCARCIRSPPQGRPRACRASTPCCANAATWSASSAASGRPTAAWLPMRMQAAEPLRLARARRRHGALALVRDGVLEDAADRADAIAASGDAIARFTRTAKATRRPAAWPTSCHAACASGTAAARHSLRNKKGCPQAALGLQRSADQKRWLIPDHESLAG